MEISNTSLDSFNYRGDEISFLSSDVPLLWEAWSTICFARAKKGTIRSLAKKRGLQRHLFKKTMELEACLRKAQAEREGESWEDEKMKQW